MATQRDNYLRINNLFHKIAEPTIDKLMENYLHRTNQSLEKFLNNTNIKHTIMHLYWNDKECCENVKDCTKSKNRPISRDKLDAYYDYGYKINSHCNVHPCLCHIIAKRIMSRDLEMPQLAFLFRQFEILNADILESVDIILKVHTKLKLDYTDQRIRANDFEKMWATLSPNLQKLGATQHDIGLVRISTIEDSKIKQIDMTSPQVCWYKSLYTCKSHKMFQKTKFTHPNIVIPIRNLVIYGAFFVCSCFERDCHS